MKNAKLRDVLAQNLVRLMETTPSLDTQVKLAKRAKIAQSTVGRILRRTAAPTLDNLESIAGAFGIQAHDLINDKSNENERELAGGLTREDLQDLRVFAEFLKFKREQETQFLERTSPKGNQASIMRAHDRTPDNDQAFTEDRIDTPKQLKRRRSAESK